MNKIFGQLKTNALMSIMRNDKSYEDFYSRYNVSDSSLRKALVGIKPYIYSILHPNREVLDNVKKFEKNDDVYTFKYNLEGGRHTSINIWLPNALSTNDCVQYRILYSGRFYEERYLDFIRKHYITPGMSIVDCGANIGNHSLYFAKICKANKVFSIEATPSTYDILNRNIELNNLDSVIKGYNYALGDGDRKVSMEIAPPQNIGANHVIENPDGDVQMVTLDELVTDKVDFIKIDVEGFEYQVLCGAKNLIEKNRPTIMIEIWDEKYEKVNALLNKYGYREQYNSVEDYVYVYAG